MNPVQAAAVLTLGLASWVGGSLVVLTVHGRSNASHSATARSELHVPRLLSSPAHPDDARRLDGVHLQEGPNNTTIFVPIEVTRGHQILLWPLSTEGDIDA